MQVSIHRQNATKKKKTFSTFQTNMSTKENNPGNFANRPHEEVVEAARKGGEASHTGGFASMDAEKQVLHILVLEWHAKFYWPSQYSLAFLRLIETVQHNIASKGGHASSGKFETGSERAREAGKKGGRVSGSGDVNDDDDDDADLGDRTQDNKTE